MKGILADNDVEGILTALVGFAGSESVFSFRTAFGGDSMGGKTFEEPISRGTLRSLSPRSLPPLERLGAKSPLRARSGRLSSSLMSLSRVTIPRGKRLSLTLTSSPFSRVSHLAFETLASTVLPVPRRNVPPPCLSPRRLSASRSAGLARRLWLRLAERRRWPSL